MRKWLGALLLMGGCTWAGLKRSRELRGRVIKLERLLMALGMVETEVCCLQTPLPQIMEALAAADGELFGAMKCADSREEAPGAVWCAAAEKMPLEEAERAVWQRLGEELSGGTEPQRSFAVAGERLRILLEEARREAGEKSRLSRVIGMCIGALAAIMLA